MTDLCADLHEPKWFGSEFLNEQAVLLLYQWSLNQDMTSGNWRTEAGPSDRTKRISVNAMKGQGHWVVLPPKGDVGSVNSWSCLQLHKGRRFGPSPSHIIRHCPRFRYFMNFAHGKTYLRAHFPWNCWWKLPDRGAVAPDRDQHHLRSWPGPTEIHVAKKCHPMWEISDSFPSPPSSIKLSPLSSSLY